MPPAEVIQSMADAITSSTPDESLMELFMSSNANAVRLSQELASSLNLNVGCVEEASRHLKSETALNNDHYPIPLPKSLASVKTPIKRSYAENPIQKISVSTESILSSLSKVASGGSQASTDLRHLETQRRATDSACNDITSALRLRALAATGADALGSRRYPEAAKCVRDFKAVQATERAKEIAGPHAMKGYERTRDVLQRTILERYESSVEGGGDLKSLSELTPLLGMLDLQNKGVGLYLRYSQASLSKVMDSGLEEDKVVESKQMANRVEEQAGVRVSRAEQKRREETRGAVTVCTKLARIYNAAVTHLRHHLPMVAYSLGNADGDAALVQLIHIEVEKRTLGIIREYVRQQGLMSLHSRAGDVANQIEERYLSDNSEEDLFGENISQAEGSQLQKKEAFEVMDDCGFKVELGSFSDINANMDEVALLMQHTESYERFIRHAIHEIEKARSLRKEHKQAERRNKRKLELENEGKDFTNEEIEAFELKEKILKEQLRSQDVLPSQTQLNELIAEVGGYYSGLERVFLLGSMQRAFFGINYPDERSYSKLTILPPNRPKNALGALALQTSVVEECMFAAQRSTLRAFATGHSGTASAAANFCADTLERILLHVLSRRADVAISLLKPGDGLLPGSAGLGQAALSVMSSAQKGLSKATSANRRPNSTADEYERMMNRERINVGIARACANLNDLEVAHDYTIRLESKLIQESEATYPAGMNETEQLSVCIKSLSGTAKSFKHSSSEAIENLIDKLMPRVRSIVNESVGQDNTGGSSFGNVIGGSGTTANTMRMNYHLDEHAFEMAQISEGYMSRLCQLIDELVFPVRSCLAPSLADDLFLGVIGGASKRLEAAIKRGQFTALGALALDSDIRFFINYTKERFDSPELGSNVTLYKACNPLARLAQIALLMNVDDLEDVLDLITSSKRKQMWDISLNDAKAYLNLRVDFEGRKVNELLQIPGGGD